MSTIEYININILAFVLLLIVFFNRNKKNLAFNSDKLFYKTILVVLLTIVFELLSWVYDGKTSAGAYFLNFTFNYLYFICTIIVPLLWVILAYLRACNNENPLKSKYRLFFIIPTVLVFLLLFINIFTKWLFYFDDNNIFVKTPIYPIFYLYTIWCYVGAIIITIVRYRKIKAKEAQSALTVMIFAALFPIIFLVFKAFYTDIYIFWPLVGLAYLTIFLHSQRGEILLDPLTKLYKRYYFDQYFEEKTNNQMANKKWALIMIDIDNMKMINDVFGHPAGDKAIQTVAEVLKKRFIKNNDFIARYGGDEFTIICSSNEEAEITNLLQKLNEDFEQLKLPNDVKITVCMGYVVYSQEYHKNRLKMLAAADQKMYEQKSRRKLEKEVIE